MTTTTTPGWPAPSVAPVDPPATAEPEGRKNPYVGPRALGRDDAIHGRAREIADLRGLLTAHRVVLLYSPSGAGKTSLIEAGLRPELERRDFIVLPTIRVGHELTPTNQGQNRYASSVIASLEERKPSGEQLTADEVASADLGEYLTELTSSDPEQKWCLLFDQFEELFTMNPADVDAKEAFLEQLGTALKNRSFWVLIAMREDFIAHLDPHAETLPTRLKTRYRLDLLGPEAAKEAARAPAAATGVDFEEAAVERLIDDLRQIQVQHFDETTIEPGPHVEPLQLQVVCRRLWSAATDSIGLDDLDKLGGVDQALALYYTDALERTVKKTSVPEAALRAWFASDLITTDGFRKPVRQGPGKQRRRKRATTNDHRDRKLGNEVLNELEAAYLIRKDRRNGTDWYELTHDRIVRPILDSNQVFRSKRRARRRRLIAIAAAVAVVVAMVALVSFTGDEASQFTATQVDIPSMPDVPTLEPGGSVRFLISPAEGDVVTASLRAEDVGATSARLRLYRVVEGELDLSELRSESLRVVGPVGEKVDESAPTESDVEVASSDIAAIERVITAQDLRLVVEVFSQPGGNFELVIERDEPASGGESALRELGAETSVGEILTAGAVASYSVAAEIDGVARVTVTPTDDTENGFDAVVTLLGGDEPVVQDNRAGGQAEILTATLTPESDYVVEVSGYEGSTGEYRVSIEQVTTTPLAVDGPVVRDRITAAGDVVTYALDDVAGGDIRVVVGSEDPDDPLDIVVALQANDGVELGRVDESGPGTAETLTATVQPSVDYVVEVSGYGDTTGSFDITIETITAIPLDVTDGRASGTIVGAGDVTTYALTIPAGTQIGEIAVIPLDDTLDVSFDVSTPFGSASFDSESEGDGEVVDFDEEGIGVFPDDQRWLLTVSSFGETVGDFEIRVTTR